MQRRCVPRTDPRYNQIRARNNDSVKRSREKSRRERDETVEAITQLEEENEELTAQIEKMRGQYKQLEELFRQHTGISMDNLMTDDLPSTSAKPPSPVNETAPPPPPSQPVLTITTNEQTTNATSAEPQLDPSTLDGAIVLINGVQYKIVSMNKP